MDFLEAIKRNVENSVLVFLKVLDVYFAAVFTMEKCLGMTTLDHVITVVPSFFRKTVSLNLSLSLYFLT